MNKKILILGRAFHPDGKETADDIYNGLKSAGKLNGHDLILGHYNELLFDISVDNIQVRDIKNGFNLTEIDTVLMTNWFSHASIRKDMAYSLALFWKKNGVAFFNTESFHSRSTSKLSQMVLAAQNDVPIPRTMFSLSFDALIKAAQEAFGFPLILKDAQASRGKGNYLIKSADEFEPLRGLHTEKSPFIAQSFIDAGNVDYRFFVAGGQTRLIIRRTGSGDSHVTNTSAGASTEVLEPTSFDEDILGLVHRCSSLLHREVTGIDIMFDKSSNKPYFLEANPIPQIATGSNVDQKLAALSEALIEAVSKEKN